MMNQTENFEIHEITRRFEQSYVINFTAVFFGDVFPLDSRGRSSEETNMTEEIVIADIAEESSPPTPEDPVDLEWVKEFMTKETIILILVSLSLLIYIIGCFMTFTFKCLLNSCSRQKFDPSKKHKRVLLVIAHPDDECMFFGPTIMNYLQASRRNFFVLCLSNGNYEGLGKTRKKEFWQSCCTMGIFSSNITLLHYDKMPDDPNLDWPTQLVSRAIVDHVDSYDIDTLITFDGKGISGHKNHVAINKTVNALITQKQWPQSCQVCVLESVNIFRMYVASFLDIAFSYWTSHFIYFVDIYQRSNIVSAMECHASQLVWFRKLYLVFSRYILINTLKEIHVAQPRIPLRKKIKNE